MKAGVIGDPISHSLSPHIFNFIAHEEKRSIHYLAYEVNEQTGKFFLDSKMKEDHYLGFNVTLPLKELFLEDIHFLSPEVKALGALNVLHFIGNEIYGFNTDIIGIQKTFEDNHFKVEEKNCFLIGAGGSAKAVAFVLGTLKAKSVLILNRSERNKELALKFTDLFPHTKWMTAKDLTDEHIKNGPFDLIVNSTPLGMFGKDPGKTFFESLSLLTFTKDALAFDLIYNPEQTTFLIKAQSLGLKTTGGLGMLIDQALATWKIWVGDLKDEKELHLKLKNFLNGILFLRQNENLIYLTGFMGVGKSTVGLELSKLLGRSFLDLDTMIETSEKSSISEIFSIKGESYFRDLERVTIEKSSHTNNSVMALGGGALMNEKNFKVITNSGYLIYLSANETTLLERLTQDHQERPILANLSLDEKSKKIKELLNQRMTIYQKALLHIQTDYRNARDIAYEIVSAFGKSENQKRRGQK
jgi:shikimate dehydrogenase